MTGAVAAVRIMEMVQADFLKYDVPHVVESYFVIQAGGTLRAYTALDKTEEKSYHK